MSDQRTRGRSFKWWVETGFLVVDTAMVVVGAMTHSVYWMVLGFGLMTITLLLERRHP